VAVRIADAIEEGLIAIRLAPYRRVFCASPDYLAAHGTPAEPDDLMQHNCLISRGTSPNQLWPVSAPGRVGHVSVRGNLACDNSQAVRTAAVEGLGIMMAPRWLVDEHLASGALVEVLPEFAPPDRAVYAVLLQRSDSSRKLAAVLDFLRECFAGLR